MYATAQEPREQILGLYRRALAHADDTIETLGLDATGQVLWWPPDQREVTLHRILVHVPADRPAVHFRFFTGQKTVRAGDQRPWSGSLTSPTSAGAAAASLTLRCARATV